MMLTASACVFANEAKGGFSLKMQSDNPKMTVGGEKKSIDEEGKVRSIGISNFYEKKFDRIMEIATIPPDV